MKVNAMSCGKMIARMLQDSASVAELAELTGLQRVTICQHLNEWHKQGAAHIESMGEDARGRCLVPEWALGPGEHIRCPITDAIRARRFREKKARVSSVFQMRAQ